MESLMTIRRRHRRRHDPRAGFYVLGVAIAMGLIMGLIALSVDTGRMSNAREELRVAMDAAALAGARSLYDQNVRENDVRRTVVSVASANQLHETDANTQLSLDRNQLNVAGGDVVLGTWDFQQRAFSPAAFPVALANVTAVQSRARLSTEARMVLLPFGSMIGSRFFDVEATATAVIAGPGRLRPDFPVVIDRSLLANVAPSLDHPVAVSVSPGGTAAAWTSFNISNTNANDVRGYINDPGSIPIVGGGDTAYATNGTVASAYQAAKDAKPPGTILVIPVAQFDNLSNPNAVTILGFVAMRVTAIVSNGSNKRIDGELVPLTRTVQSTELARCFGFNCAPAMVN